MEQARDARTESLPEPWRSLSATVEPPHPHLWTYWDLARDLDAEAESDRSRLFRRILHSLQWPEKSVIFWPPSCFEQGELVLRADIFWQGVEWIQPRYIVCFGREAFRGLFPDRADKYGSFQADALTVVHLPGPGDMLPDNRKAKQLVWQFLKSLPSE
jgi:hypothetical protein